MRGAPETCQIAGCTYRQLDYWCRRGVLNNNAAGSGSRRTFTDEEIEALAACKSAIDFLPSTDAMRAVVDAVLTAPVAPGDYIWIRGRDVGRTSDPFTIVAEEPVLLIPLRPIDDLLGLVTA